VWAFDVSSGWKPTIFLEKDYLRSIHESQPDRSRDRNRYPKYFLEPKIWELLEWFHDYAAAFDTQILPEMHEHYSYQLKLSAKGYWCYDFSRPMLVLHALYAGKTRTLKSWLKKCPRKQITTLNTHDAYKNFRHMRSQFRKQAKKPDGYSLAKALMAYSERDNDYIREIQDMITNNRELMGEL
jgi:hypothetical protein